MKKSKNRRSSIDEILNDRAYNQRLRRLVRKSMFFEEEATTLTELIMLFAAFLSETEEGHRVAY